MRHSAVLRAAVALSLIAASSPALAQHLHTNDRWKECAIVLDPSLTPEAWRQFVREVGLVTYFRPLASARSLGRGRFEIGITQTSTWIDDADAAWNDTFTHPDDEHWLFEGSSLPIPGLVGRVGVTDRLDAGAYFTKAIGANYGFAGGELQYSVYGGSRTAVAARVNAVHLFGPEDMTATTYGLGLVASRDVARVTPYVSVSGYLARARETTTSVDLDPESAFGAQATIGVAARLSVMRLGAEVNLARVPGLAVKVAFGR